MISTEPQKPRRKTPKKITAQYLENSALYYLSRFATSSENLRRVMMRKVVKSARHHDADPDDGKVLVDAMIERFLRSGLLDDGGYARARAASLHQRGNSSRIIRGKLKQKGLDEDTIEQALAALRDDDDDPERTAAIRFARRRRLGPFATRLQEDGVREKHLAAMARAGFSYDMARRIIDTENEDDLQLI
ncbi:MAG: regulatory protein RecX [Alphaproteobacteria bacterium]|jgi:regulatory protein|nr:regulatory protein RecX [Alphaproteobacteria bacterium]MBT7943417.1 regulatory protein RecX [Alphaproteobacteria bacterium]